MSHKHKTIEKAGTPEAYPAGSFFASYKPYAVIAFAGLLLYFRTVFFDFSYLDDNGLMDKFDFISKLANLPDFFRRDAFNAVSGGSYYRPMLTVSFMLDALWGGKNPGAYHFSNLVMHLAVCGLFYRVLLKLNISRAPAFFWALFFTVHPALTQAVAWVPGRNDILLAFFVLLSFLSFLAFLEERTKTRLAAHLLFLLLALLTKETAAVLCALCAFYLAFMRERQRESGGDALLWAGWFVVVAAWLAARAEVLKNVMGDAPFDILASLSGNFPALAAYLGKIFFPVNLGILQVLRDLPAWYGLAAVGLTGFLIYASKTKRVNYLVFGGLWFLLFLLPSFIQSSAAVPNFSEHRIYLPLAGFIFLLAELDLRGVFKLSGRGAAAAGAVVLCLLAAVSFFYSGHFRDKISFWKKAVASSPGSAFNHNNLGAMYYLDGDLSNAQRVLEAAAAINPGERRVHSNLGLVYMDTGRPKEAEAEYLKEIAIDARCDNAYLNLGLLYYDLGLVDKAEAVWETALLINPDFAKVYTNLAVLNYRRRNAARTKYYIEQMIRRNIYVPPGLLTPFAPAGKK
ncbi:MAG TPA: tetratricopeptide repeat protein [Elusimicrobiales bacterium]|nr:tetratricopeptide repeat protein [Elusimicrobiales bacterium]